MEFYQSLLIMSFISGLKIQLNNKLLSFVKWKIALTLILLLNGQNVENI